jgi:acyl-ACP thioesterase
MRFARPIRLGERVVVKTWPTPPTRVIFGREYQFESEAGEILLCATSRWCLMDMQAGKILTSKAIDNQDYSTYNTKKLFEDVKWKLPAFTPDEGELRFTLTIANSEYDHNYHVNNTRYADYCFNCFSVAELKDKQLKEFSISYIKQCKEGETLRFYRKHAEDGGWLAHGFNEAGEVVVQSHILFEE